MHRAEFVRLNTHHNMVRSRGRQDRAFLKESRLASARRALKQQRLILAAATPFFGGQLQRLQRFAVEKTLTVTTTAKGGNVELLREVGAPRTQF